MNKCNTVYFIWSLKRSGAHGVEAWLFPHFSNHVFFNNVRPQAPLSGAHLKYKNADDSVTWDELAFGFEDIPFFLNGGSIKSCEDILKVAGLTGRCNRFVNIIVLRDVANLLSSRLKIIRDGVSHPMSADRETLRLWRLYAKEFTGATNYLSNKVTVNFNKWFIDKKYRRKLAARIGLQFTDKGKDTLYITPNNSKSSSFDTLRDTSSISNLKVFDRWKYFEDDEEYLMTLSDPDTLALSEEIFGDIPADLALKLKL